MDQDARPEAPADGPTSSHRALAVALASLLWLGPSGAWGRPEAEAAAHWVGTWSAAPQLVESSNMPPSPGLTGNSLRQIVRVSIGGDTLRVRFSNDFGTGSVTMESVTIAVSKGRGAIDVSTAKGLTFGGKAAVTMGANSSVASDPIAFETASRTDLAITIHYGQTSTTVTGHPGSRTTSCILAGDKTSSADFAGAATTEHWYNIAAVDVMAPSTAACVAILGNSITDGRGSTTNSQNRWTDILSEALLKNPGAAQVGVLNLGIGGNCVLSGGLGPTGVARYKRDVLEQSGAAWVVVFEGVNDIGTVANAAAATTMSNNLIGAYKQMIADARAKNLKVYGATIMPFGGNSYYNRYSEACRSSVNDWIRHGGQYDAVIDFDKTMRSSQDTTKLAGSTYQSDGLHPDAAGYETMGSSIDLGLFGGSGASSTDTRKERGYVLGESFANPVDGGTTIPFEIPRGSFVSLKLYSVDGKAIAELAGRDFPSGMHEVGLGGRHLPPGVYLYSIEAGPFFASRKMDIRGQ